MNTPENKTLSVLERCKSIAIALVGAGMAGKGITYFSPQLSYDIPRLLLPVYKILGATGLAISMVLLGLALVIWSYLRWKSTSGKPAQWVLVAGLLSVLVVGGIYMFNQKKSDSSAHTNITTRMTGGGQEVPSGTVAEVAFPSSFGADSKLQYEQLVKELEATITAKNTGKSWRAYNKLNVFTATLKPDQNNKEHADFILAQARKMDQYALQIKDQTIAP